MKLIPETKEEAEDRIRDLGEAIGLLISLQDDQVYVETATVRECVTWRAALAFSLRVSLATAVEHGIDILSECNLRWEGLVKVLPHRPQPDPLLIDYDGRYWVPDAGTFELWGGEEDPMDTLVSSHVAQCNLTKFIENRSLTSLVLVRDLMAAQSEYIREVKGVTPEEEELHFRETHHAVPFSSNDPIMVTRDEVLASISGVPGKSEIAGSRALEFPEV